MATAENSQSQHRITAVPSPLPALLQAGGTDGGTGLNYFKVHMHWSGPQLIFDLTFHLPPGRQDLSPDRLDTEKSEN